MIENVGVRGLRIKVLEDSVLSTSNANVILARADTVITGPGMLTLTNTCADGGSGIFAIGSDVTVVLDEARVGTDARYGVVGPYGSNQTRLVVSHSRLVCANASGGAVVDFGGGILLRGCRIQLPSKAKVSDNGRDIVNSKGEPAVYVAIGLQNRTNPFVDISDSASYRDAALWAYYHWPEQITSGTDATHFTPNMTATRGQAVRFLWNAVGKPEPADTKNPFTDIVKGWYYYDAVFWAYYNDPRITDGTTATTFSPDKDCNRAQIITFLWKAVGRPAPTISNPYSDVPTGKYYTEAAIWAYENGIERGSGGKFQYNTECTRAAIVTYLYRFYTGHDLAG